MPTVKPNKSEEVIGEIFKNQETVFGLREFDGIDVYDVLYISEQEPNRFYIKDLKSGNQKFVYDKDKKTGKPEEIVRQLWLYKLHSHYLYPYDRIETEKSVHFGREVHAKAADIVIYKKDKITPFIIVEVKNPDEKKAIDQLKSYLSSEGAEIGVWSNGKEKVVLYRPYPQEFEDSLVDIPRADQTIDDLFEIKRKWSELNPKFDFAEIIKLLEEVALAGSGANVFEEIFKLIYAKLYDEKIAQEKREGEEVIFRKYKDTEKTYEIVNDLFKNAVREWPDTFEPTDRIRLSPARLSVCVPFLEDIRLFETGLAELEIIDRAFEHLITEVSKGQKGQYFTPRHVIKMCVKMLNPKDEEYIIDPACGSGGFLLHSMYYVWEKLPNESARKSYAGRFLFGIDFDDNMRRISQALMLIAGDGKHHIFKRDSLDARDWQGTESEDARVALRQNHLLHSFNNSAEDRENNLSYRFLDFDVLMTNPPFAGENPESGILRQYQLAKKDGKLKNNMERHILFIERDLDAIKPGGRMAIVLPQGVLNNTNMEYVRQFLFDKARILAVVGLHTNTFKLPAPARGTATKTSVLFLQKWGESEEPLKDYPIFMAVSKKGGKDNSGDYIYKKDAAGNYVHDSRGRKVLDHDLDQIAEEFLKFAKDQNFSFWR